MRCSLTPVVAPSPDPSPGGSCGTCALLGEQRLAAFSQAVPVSEPDRSVTALCRSRRLARAARRRSGHRCSELRGGFDVIGSCVRGNGVPILRIQAITEPRRGVIVVSKLWRTRARADRYPLLFVCVAAALVVSTPATRAAPSPATTPHSILVMLVYWNQPDTVTPAEATAVVGEQDSAWFEENSYGAFRTTGAATPWMPITHSDCVNDLDSIRADAEAQARFRGIEPDGYDTVMVYFPAADCGGWAGLTASRRLVFLNGHMSRFITVHELGHTLGLAHSHSLSCLDPSGTPVPLSTDCTRSEQGDSFDTMGNSFFGDGHFNAAQKAHLGWLEGDVRTVTRRARVLIAPYETSTGVEAVKVVTNNHTYWLEYRQPIGADTFLTQHPGASDGVLVHAESAAGGTDLLDMRPGTAADFSDAALPGGATWTTPEGAVIRVDYATTKGATVRVQVPPTAR